MDLEIYQDYVLRGQTVPPSTPRELAAYGTSIRVINAVLGLAGEAGEVANMMKPDKRTSGQPLDLEKLELELGDVLWYLTCLAGLMGWSLEDLAESNFLKLSKRYPAAYPLSALEPEAPELIND